MRDAWPRLDQIFSCGGFAPSAPVRLSGGRYSMQLLDQHPVDLLIVELGDIEAPLRLNPEDERTHWEKLVDHTATQKAPLVVIESWNSAATGWIQGPMSKGIRTRWQKRGYASRFIQLDATTVGGSVRQQRLMVVRLKQHLQPYWMWSTRDEESAPRPMQNLLRPVGLVPRHKYSTPPKGSLVYDARSDPMPCRLGSWIKTEKGVRRLLPEELGRGLGIGKEYMDEEPSGKGLRRTTSVFHWEFLSSSLLFPDKPEAEPGVFIPGVSHADLEFNAVLSSLAAEDRHLLGEPEVHPTKWAPPDLSKEGLWYHERMASLKRVCLEQGEDWEIVRQEGDRILDIHRRNYDEHGPRPVQLQLIWWEFPPEHRGAIRNGSRMNFLDTPVPRASPNSEMTPEQAKVAGEFVDELIELKVLRLPPAGREIKANGPLFCVAKPGQPGQWRVISDMKSSGQNSCIAPDPVYLNRPLHILDQMYTGGYSAVVDASKFFYQFKTHPDDRPWLGILHPVTQVLLEYCGLPMGSGNSPALACRYGLSLLRLLREANGVFARMKCRANCWWTHFAYRGYDPKLGHGFAFFRKDGLPAVLIWVHVDDFMIHGADLASTQQGLDEFLDLSVRVGLLCHPKKLFPPSQVQTYTGFIFDTRGIPTLRIPCAKRERALAMVEHLLSARHEVSRLALSVVSGTLESMAEATPARIGHTYLREFHSLVHPEGYGTGAAVYYTSATISDKVRNELSWWRLLLRGDIGRPTRSLRAGTLIPTFGDGSGTGTGGTIMIPDQPLTAWMGQWNPFVYKFSSNWKEMQTLQLTMEQLLAHSSQEVCGTTLFYFTDNSTTYWAINKGGSRAPLLHALVRSIKLMELKLRCTLVVVHVPGLVMITQGTDGLSRGIWMSQLHDTLDQPTINSHIFAPTAYDPGLVRFLIDLFDLPQKWSGSRWDRPWSARGVLHRFTVWAPPPEVLRQLLIFFLETWVESPLDTSAMFIVPRTLSHSWTGLSRHLVELGTWPPSELPLRWRPLLPIPIVVLIVRPHVRSLDTSNRGYLDTHPVSQAVARRHESEAEFMRGLQPASLPY